MLFARGWTDGLPVRRSNCGTRSPPWWRASGRDAAEGHRPDPAALGRMATIEKIAINAVLSGCRPEYFPVVLAAIDALLDNDCQLYSIQTATNTTAPLSIVNGPVAKRDRHQCPRQRVRAGHAAPTPRSAGRCSSAFRNIGGDIAGETDMATHGQAGKIHRLHRRGGRRQPVAAVSCRRRLRRGRQHRHRVSPRSPPHNIFTYGCETGIRHSRTVHRRLTMGLGHNNIIFPTGPLFVVSPEHAATMARDGIGKKEIRNAVFERAPDPVDAVCQSQRRGTSGTGAPAGLPRSATRTISGLRTGPEDIYVVVAGGAGIHSLFVPTAFSYRPVTRRIVS